MSNEIQAYKGFRDLSNVLESYIKNVEDNNVINILELGAKAFVNDLLKLPKPISDIRKAGYTHLIDTFAYRTKKNEVEAGWGKYYGPMVEHGTKNMNASPHVYPLWEKNKEKYYKMMLTKIGLQTW